MILRDPERGCALWLKVAMPEMDRGLSLDGYDAGPHILVQILACVPSGIPPISGTVIEANSHMLPPTADASHSFAFRQSFVSLPSLGVSLLVRGR